MAVTSPAVKIDGAQGEGGGQLLRMALSLAAVRGTPIEVHSIRARRKRPGLQPQHLAAIRALARICNGRLEGDSPGSDWVRFWPGAPRAGDYRFDIGTAGAATLVLQALLPVLAMAGRSRIHVTGGTHVPWSPPADYLGQVLLPLLAAMGVHAGLEVGSWGFYPQGGGGVTLEIERAETLAPLTRLGRRGPVRLQGLSAVSRLSASIAERQRDQALQRLTQAGYAADIAIREVKARDPGSFLLLMAESQGPLGGFSSLGRRGVPAEQVADEVVDAFLAFIGADAGCDPHLADQLVVPMALAAGTSRLTTSRVSRHLVTLVEVVRQLLGCPVHLDGEEGAPGSVTLEGIGMTAGEPRRGDAEAPAGAIIPHSAIRIPQSSFPAPSPQPPTPAVRKARVADVPAMQRLLAHYAARGDVLPRTLNEMYQHLRDFFVCEENGEVVGLVALFLYWEDLAEVRSLAVKEEVAGRGLGGALVRACLQEARDLGVRQVFALTNRPGFFERLGFRVADKRDLPQKIWKDCIRCAKFAACDETALIREA